MSRSVSARVSEPLQPAQVHRLLWAKTRSDGATHALTCHLIHTAQVAHVLWRNGIGGGLRGQLADAPGLHSDTAGALIGLWAGLRDLDKAFSPHAWGSTGRKAPNHRHCCHFSYEIFNGKRDHEK